VDIAYPIIDDTTGNGHDGTTDADAGGAGIFNQDISYVRANTDETSFTNVSDVRTLTDGFTISGWFNPDDYADNDYIVDNRQFRIITYQGSILFGNSAGMIHNCANDVWDTGTWYYLDFVWGGEDNQDSLQMFINGTNYTATCTDLGNFIGWGDTTSDWLMGEGGHGGDFWGGDIDEFMVMNNTITEDCSAWRYNAGSPTATQQYPFGIPPPPPAGSNFSITAIDEWNTTAIISFNATVNGSIYQSNASGVIQTNISSNTTDLINITIWGATDYFDRNYFEYNASTDLVAELHQAEVCLNASAKVSQGPVAGVTFTIDGVTQTCYNLSTGLYSIQADKVDASTKP